VVLATTASIATNATLYKNLRFDPVRDFAPVALLASSPFMLAIHPSITRQNVTELIAFARARPGQLTYASTGSGSAPHLTAELFKVRAGIDLLHVPYQGSSPALVDLVSGQVSMMFSSTSALLPSVQAGRLRGLAMTSSKRSPFVPQLPTVAEAGLPGFESGTWFALFAPAGTPREVVTWLNAAVARMARCRK